MQNHTQLPTGRSFSYETERFILRLPSTDYLREIHDFLYRNRSCFEKYEPSAPENYYTLDFQQTLAKCVRADMDLLKNDPFMRKLIGPGMRIIAPLL